MASAETARTAEERETYTHPYGEEFRRLHGGRNAAYDAAFFLPHLRSGMRLLDCGCGPGSITIGLAQAVAPGTVEAIDIAEAQLMHARDLAAERGVGNVRFNPGDIYALPFPDNSFDAAFAHNVLMHLRDRPRALRELRRVLKPGGALGIRDDDWGAYLAEPTTAALAAAFELVVRMVAHNGGDPHYARRQCRLLREAGFVQVEGYATVAGSGTTEPVANLAAALARQLQDPALVAVALREGFADRRALGDLVAAVRAWGASPDAFLAFVKPAAVGRVPD